MKFGLIYELQMQKPWEENQEYKTYHQALDQIELADKVGFDYVWEVEHHFLVEYSHSSAPEVFLAAASQRTKNIRIGHGVALCPAPFNHPIRVAERAAALDIVSDGRVDLGTGRSITEQELGGFGIDPADSRPMWEEAIEMIPKMWTNETFAWEGNYFVGPAAHGPAEADPEAAPAAVDGLHAAGELPDRGLEGPRCAVVRVHRAGRARGVAVGLPRRDCRREAGGMFINNQFAATSFASVAPTDEEALQVRAAGGGLLPGIDRASCSCRGRRRTNVPSSYQYYSDAGGDG